MATAKTIDTEKLAELANGLITYERAKHNVDPRDTLERTTFRLESDEGYKYGVYKRSQKKLSKGGSYVDIVLSAIADGNLVSFYQKGYLDDLINEKGPEDLEQALELLYEGDDDQEAFNEIVNYIGGRFDIVGLIFFIKDCEKYLPIRSSIFDKKFAVLGIDSDLDSHCSWDKYQEYIGWIRDIRQFLVKHINKDITLLDAHSFVWIVDGLKKYINGGIQLVENKKHEIGEIIGYTCELGFEYVIVRFGKKKVKFDKNTAFKAGYLKLLPSGFDIYLDEKVDRNDSEETDNNRTYKKVVEITEALLRCVQKQRWSITYQELSDMTKTKPHRFLELPKILDKINASCVKLNLPYISAIVVEAKKGVPGPGFRPLYESRYGYDHFMSDKVIMQNEIAKIKECKTWSALADEYGITLFSDKDEELESLMAHNEVIDVKSIRDINAEEIQEKRDNDYPKKYVTNLNITCAQWRDLLDDPDVFKDSDIELLKRIYMHDNHAATATELSVQDGSTSSSYNAPVVALAKRISNALDLEPIVRKDGSRIWWRIPFWGRYIDNGNFEWKIRPELVEALENKYPELSYEIANEEEDEQLIDFLKNASLAEVSGGFEYIKGAKPKEEPKYVEGRKTYPRNHQTAINALAHACYKCEVDSIHNTFIRKASDKPYTEPHHLVPMSFSDEFDVSLDREQNIVSLCSNCHNEIHYGRDAKMLIEKLYNDRKELLKSVGIDVTLEQLLEMYGIHD